MYNYELFHICKGNQLSLPLSDLLPTGLVVLVRLLKIPFISINNQKVCVFMYATKVFAVFWLQCLKVEY